jgi:membrane protein required for beta-lactamase induction
VKATLHEELMRKAGFAAEGDEAPVRHRSAVRSWLRAAIAILFVASLLLWVLLSIVGLPKGLPPALVWVLLPFAAIGFVGDLVLGLVRFERRR